MIRQSTTPSRVMLAALLSMLAIMTLHGQQPDDPAGLRDRIRGRYDIVALQQGVALVPKQPTSDIRIIEIRDGAVAINGDEVTGRQLRDRVGADADLILRISYLSAAEQRLLATSAASAPAEAPPPAVAEPPAPRQGGPRRARRGGDTVRVMGDVTVGRDERVQGDVVAVMGNAQIDGEVDGDLTVVMGSATLGPESLVTGDVNVVGGRLSRAPGARIEGTVNNVGSGARGRTWSSSSVPAMIRDSFLCRLGSLAGTRRRIALIALLALALVAFGRTSVERVADRAAADPVRAGLIGFAAQILFVPVLILTIVVLAVSIVGIPLLALVPFAIVLAVIVLVMGFTGVAYHVGRVVAERLGWTGRGEYVKVLLGVVVIAAFTVLARSVALVTGGMFGWPLSAVGYLVEYVAWTLGLGAAIMVIPRGRRVPPVPPVPPPVPA